MQFKQWLGRLICEWLDYETPPRGILWPFPSVSGGSFTDPAPASASGPPEHVMSAVLAEPDITLSINNTLTLTANNVYSMKFHPGNRAHVANMGAGKIWFRVDGQTTSVNDTQSEMLPPGVADNDVIVSNYMSMVSDVGATVVIRCYY